MLQVCSNLRLILTHHNKGLTLTVSPYVHFPCATWKVESVRAIGMGRKLRELREFF